MHGSRLSAALETRNQIPFIGAYDVFSASLAYRYFDGIFVSGFSFAASRYGLPDVGFIAWPDIVEVTQRIRSILPDAHIIVDMDDGYGDPVVAAHAAVALQEAGASAIILEDQRRPKKCGHLDGKELLDLDAYIAKLATVLEARDDLLVIARTDATDSDEMMARALASAAAGADGLLVDGLSDLDVLRNISSTTDCALAFNQIAGGRSAGRSFTELGEAGVKVVIYSTPCLFAAHAAIDQDLSSLAEADGVLPEPTAGRVGLKDCAAILDENLLRRHKR